MSDAGQEIILCFECGAKNRLARNYAGSPMCGKCGKPLPVQPRATRVKQPTVVDAVVSADGQGKPSRTATKPLLAVGAIAVAAGFFAFQGMEAVAPVNPARLPPKAIEAVKMDPRDQPAAPASLPLRSPEPHKPWERDREQQGEIDRRFSPSPPVKEAVSQSHVPVLRPVPVKPGILWDRTGRPRVAPLEIITQPGGAYYVKLIDAKSQAEMMGLYLIGGKTFEIEVPLGSYETRYASGSVWYGSTLHFGSNTSYSKSNKILNFRETSDGFSGFTIELIKQKDGNFARYDITRDMF